MVMPELADVFDGSHITDYDVRSALDQLFPWPADPAKAGAIYYSAHGYTARERVLYAGWSMVERGCYPDAELIARDLGLRLGDVEDHVKALAREGLWGVQRGADI